MSVSVANVWLSFFFLFFSQGTAIRDGIQQRLLRQESEENRRLLQNGLTISEDNDNEQMSDDNDHEDLSVSNKETEIVKK